MNDKKKYDAIIIGGGVTGTALFFMLANYTNLKRIALLEKYGALAQINSHYNNNSQTLHFGDIETNFSLEKTKEVKAAAEMTKIYAEKYSQGKILFNKTYKMVLGVGEKESQVLEKRFSEIKPLFPKLKKITREEICRLEPSLVNGRNPNEKILALCTEDGFAINYNYLSESFAKEALKAGRETQLFLKTKAEKIEKTGNSYLVKTNNGAFSAKTVVSAAGAYSLIFAQSLGYGKDIGIMPVAGNFYAGKSLLRGKVYRVQIPGLPFAAIHGDPSVKNPEETRFGPTAMVLPFFERHKWNTMPDYIKTSLLNPKVLFSTAAVLLNPIFFLFGLKNIAFEIPILGKWLFIKEVKKIVPLIKWRDLKLAKGVGGIRPQIIDLKEKKFMMGEAKLIGQNIIFDITPSPGATVCLKNAEISARKIVEFLGDDYKFDENKFKQDFL